jgi:signal transduction histidine kinase
MYFYLPLLAMAAVPILPAMHSRPTFSRMLLFFSTNGLAIVTAVHLGEESRINIAALVALCHTLLVTRLREYALLGFGIGMATCTLLVYHIVPDGLLVAVGQYPKFAPQIAAAVEFAAVTIVGIQIVVLRVRLSDRTQKLRESSESLQEQVEKLSEANQALNSAKEANATLVRILCHDLATPVSTVELCLNRPNFGDREVEIIRRSVKKVKETIADVRDLQRLHAAKIEISRVAEDPRVLLLELKDLFAAELMAKDLELLIYTPDSPAYCLLDRSLVANQVFANVLRNAIKFSNRNSRIEVTVLPGEEAVSVHFRDFGMGIPEELLVKLFDIYRDATLQLTRWLLN